MRYVKSITGQTGWRTRGKKKNEQLQKITSQKRFGLKSKRCVSDRSPKTTYAFINCALPFSTKMILFFPSYINLFWFSGWRFVTHCLRLTMRPQWSHVGTSHYLLYGVKWSSFNHLSHNVTLHRRWGQRAGGKPIKLHVTIHNQVSHAIAPPS